MNELSTTIESCLRMIAGWAPGWEPIVAMTDNDAGEILAAENVFPGLIHFICEFHVEQCWKRKLSCLGGESLQ